MPVKTNDTHRFKDSIRQGGGADKPFGSRRQLDVEKNYSQGRHEAWTWPPSVGTPNRLPKDGK
jgi:hypothetical protein